MNSNSRTARRIIRERSAATRLAQSLGRGRALKTHAVAAGVDAKTADGVASGLRSVAKRLGVEPVKVTRTHRGAARLRPSYHYTPAQVAALRAAYRPRKAEYKAAVELMALAA
ncbi:hypothetical protein [Streptomyces scabiei]|uniref:hypothetical protein n=1 Tax=Streptomyces scabiei TaxID=1930 RepID=UPI001B33F375|nr:hypothetical protein [Streptomyces sp. LBUM 1481]MBP5896355.1 hypothetical protein [Streptomyces sp. LBUM 1481]